jgi:hypothetical protein
VTGSIVLSLIVTALRSPQATFPEEFNLFTSEQLLEALSHMMSLENRLRALIALTLDGEPCPPTNHFD